MERVGCFCSGKNPCRIVLKHNRKRQEFVNQKSNGTSSPAFNDRETVRVTLNFRNLRTVAVPHPRVTLKFST